MCVVVDEQVERLVRHTHVRNEDGSFRQLFRVVIGSVPKGKLVLLVKICWTCRTSCAMGCVQSISCCQGCQLAIWRRKIVSVWPSKVSTSRFLRWRV